MRIACLAFFFLFYHSLLQAQSVQHKWTRTVGSTGTDYGRASVVDAMGNVYTTGHFMGTVDFDPGPGIYSLTAVDSSDVFLVKLDANGVFQWAKAVGGAGEEISFAITLDKSKNIYVAGIFQSVVDFDPGAGEYKVRASDNAHSGFILKLSNAGSFLWAATFDEARIGDLALDVAGNVVAAGSFTGTTDFDPGPARYNLTAAGYRGRYDGQSDAVVVKLTGNGSFLWAKQMGGVSQDYASAIVLDVSGNVYTVGNYSSDGDFDPGPDVFLLTGFSRNIFVSKLDPSGKFVWARRIGVAPYQYARDIVIGAGGHLYLCGYFYGPTDFDPGAWEFILHPPTSSADIFVCSFDTDGHFIWAKQMGGPGEEFCAALAVDQEGNLYTTGGFTETADFDPGAGVYALSGKGQYDVYISKLDRNGNFIWAKTMGAVGFDAGYNVIVDGAQNVYTTGHFQRTVDFGPESGTLTITSAGQSDAFVQKLSQCLNVTYANISKIVCGAYAMNGQTYTSSGVYTQILTNRFSCDSIITLNLIVGGFTKTDTVVACESYKWQGRSYAASGSYSVRFSGADGCDSILNLRLTIKNKILTVINKSLCEGQNYEGFTLPGTYTNTFVAANGCDSTRTLHLSVKPTPRTVLKATICEGQVYLGYAVGGTYTDTLAAANGCDSIRTLQLVVNPKKAVTRDIFICEGQHYFAGGVNQTTSGVYRDTLTSVTGCDSIITTNLVVYPKPKPNLGENKNLCEGVTITLSPGTFTSYQWQDQSTSVQYIARDTGTYWVTVSDQHGCSASDTFQINRVLPIPKDFLKAVDSICQYDKLVLSPSKNFESYLWSTGSRQSTITIDRSGTYALSVTDTNGCSGKDTIMIIQKQCLSGLFVPTGFTPNGDGKNDLFRPKLLGNVKAYQLRIYDRWGTVVFQTNDTSKGWDGRVSSVKQSNSVFVWTVLYQLEGDVQRFEKGTVLLLL